MDNALTPTRPMSALSPDFAAARPLAEIVEAAIRAAGTSEQTARAYRASIGQFIEWMSCQKPDIEPFVTVKRHLRSVQYDYGTTPAGVLRSVTQGELDKWRESLAQDGASINTTSSRLFAVRTFLSVALRDNVLTGEQAQNMGLRPYITKHRRDKKPVGRRLSTDEVRKLRAVIIAPGQTNRTRRDLAMLDLMLFAGLRRDEVASLTPDDCKMDNGKRVLMIAGKGGKTRRIEIHTVLERSLDAWMTARGMAWDDDEPMFVSVNKGDRIGIARVDSNVIWRVLGAYAKHAGIGEVHPHDLRRTFARRLHDSNMPLAEIQQLLGHESPQTTAHYVGMNGSGDVSRLEY